MAILLRKESGPAGATAGPDRRQSKETDARILLHHDARGN